MTNLDRRAKAIADGLLVPSMLDAPQLGWLYDLAGQAPDGAACEVGVWKGGSFVCWAQAREGRGNLYAVDPFTGQKWQRGYSAFNAALDRVGLRDLVTIILLPSVEAVGHIGEPLAFCFIDADHSEAGIPHDMEVYPDLIMPGGVLVLHDYISSKPTARVGAAVNAWRAGSGRVWERLGLI